MRISDSTLLRTSLLVSFCGLLGLVYIFSTADVPVVSAEQATAYDDGYVVEMSGIVRDISSTPKVTHFTLDHRCEMAVVMFSQEALLEGEEVIVRGELTTYDGKREIIADHITVQ